MNSLCFSSLLVQCVIVQTNLRQMKGSGPTITFSHFFLYVGIFVLCSNCIKIWNSTMKVVWNSGFVPFPFIVRFFFFFVTYYPYYVSKLNQITKERIKIDPNSFVLSKSKSKCFFFIDQGENIWSNIYMSFFISC